MSPDREWVVSVIARYERPLQAYVRRLLPDPDRCRDVVQDAFLQLCQQSHADLNDRIAPWLFAVCRRRVVDIVRKEKRMVATLKPTDKTAARPADPSQTIETKDSVRHVLARLDQLPADQNEAVRLRFHNQFSYREIAEVMGLSESHVGVLLHNALKTLRQSLPQLA